MKIILFAVCWDTTLVLSIPWESEGLYKAGLVFLFVCFRQKWKTKALYDLKFNLSKICSDQERCIAGQ